MSAHLPEERLVELTNGAADASAHDRAHLASCALCRAGLADWQAAARTVQAATAPLTRPAAALPHLWGALDDASSPAPFPAPRLASVRRVLAVAWWLVAGQAVVVGRRVWVATAVVLAAGCAAAVLLETQPAAVLLLSLLAPVVAAVGVALACGPENDPAAELLAATPTSPKTVLLARLTLVVGYDLALALIGNAVVVAVRGDLALWAVVAEWLGPLLWLSAGALLLAVVRGPAVGVPVALGVWSLRVLTLDLAGGLAPLAGVLDVLWATTPATGALAAALLAAALLATRTAPGTR